MKKSASKYPLINSQLPVFQDKSTSISSLKLDSMAYGMGSCCLQITISATSLSSARFIYDQLAILSPLFMALSASTPLQHGYLTDVDTRWTMISQSVDCRNKVEREKGERYIGKSRYDSISYYIAEDDNKFFKNEYNDLKNYLDPEIREFIIQ